ncbi:MAG: serine/threonine protein kinase, partial [Chloroflexi bacterium]
MNLTGQTLGKYKLIRRLGKGGMAQVYQANQPTIDRMVAVKVLHSHLAESDDFVTRFKREARSLGQLQHPNIVRVIDFDASGEMYFMVMDYIPGKTLRDYLDEQGALSSSEALTLSGQLTDALAYAHQNGMIHRDIKPANVMFADIDCTQAVLTDFGITRLMGDDSLTMTGALVGTPAYMSPEAVLGEKVDGRSDIYSLGVILYEMVTGRTPYQGNTPLSLVVKQVHEPLTSPLEHNPDLPLPLVNILEKSLAKSAEDRYQTAEELLAAIQEAQQSLGDTAYSATIAGTKQVAETAVYPDPPTTIKPKQTTTNRTPWIVGGVLAAIILFAGIFLISRNNNASDETATSTALSAGISITQTTAPTIEPAATDVPALIADPTKPAPEPTVEPTSEPTAKPTETAVSIPFDTPNRFGGLRFTDNGITLQINRVLQPPADFHHELWLESSNGDLLNMGEVVVENGRIFTTVDLNENVLPTTSRVLLSVEPDEIDATEITGDIAFTGELTDAFISEIRQVLVDGGDGVGLLDNALGQTAVAAQHAGFSLDALAANNLTEAKQHLEHVVNILDGESGERFGDVNLDGQTQNPGNGIGVRVYLEKSREHLQQALQTDSITIVQQQQGAEAIAAVDNSLITLENIFDNALTMLSTDTPAEAQPFAEALQAGLNE